MRVEKFGYMCEYNKYHNQYVVEFPNGYGASVVGGALGLYGDGVHSFEVAVLKNGQVCYDTPITNDVMGYQTEEEVTDILRQIETL